MIKTIRYKNESVLQYSIAYKNESVLMIKTIRYSRSSIGLQEWECTDDKNNQVHDPV